MRTNLVSSLLLTSLLLTSPLITSPAFVQKQPAPAKADGSHSTTKAAAGATTPKYLTVPFDTDATNLGLGFAGHDIVAVYKAMKNPAKITPKGEFETSAQYDARNAEFATKPIFGSVSPNDHFAFVIPKNMVQGSWPLKLTYDADLRLMQADFTGEYSDFSLDADKARRTTVLMREVESDRQQGNGAPGATSRAVPGRPDFYSISLAKDWLFQPGRSQLSFSHLLDVAPDEAKSLKPDLQALMVCRLTPPWTRRNVFGHGSVRSGRLFEVNYLEVILEQVWIYNARTGEVLEKITEESLGENKNQQLALKSRQTPLILELSSENLAIAYLKIDGVPKQQQTFYKERPLTVTATREIEIMIANPKLSELDFQLNGQPYSPEWKKVSRFVGNQEFVESATAVITLPAK